MPSPFPGMDPFIEACGRWEDFHSQLIGEMHRTLAAAVPKRYYVGLGVRSYIALVGAEGNEAKPFLPDVAITSPANESPTNRASAAVAEALDSEAIPMQAFVAEPFRETFLEIYDGDSEERLVTCIEVLSPSNKRPGSKGRKLYLRKRQSLLLGAANLVELDLLRGGQRMPMRTAWPASPYTLLVSRQEFAPSCKVWPAYFQRPLPAIPVPLAPPDPDVRLDLQPLLAAVYARSQYDRRLDYARSLQPPLSEEESAWLSERLRVRSETPR